MKVSQIKNNKGLSITELIIAVGIVSIISLAIFGFLQMTQKASQKIETNIENRIDKLLADKIILKDFRNAEVSINQINLLDTSNRNFYELKNDDNQFSSTTASGTSMAPPPKPNFNPNERELILNKNTPEKSLYILSLNTSKAPSINMDPSFAFDIGNEPSDANLATPLTFKGVNNNNFITNQNKTLRKELGDATKGLDESQLLLVESTSPMTVTSENLQLRSAVFLGFPNNSVGNIDQYKISENSKVLLESKIYLTNNNIVTPTNLNDFLWNLPQHGVGGSGIRVSAVKLIKYNLKCPTNEKVGCTLVRSELMKTSSEIKFTNETEIMRNLKSVTFFRKSIDNFIVEIKYEIKK